ncbi:MAG: hypothetical protein PVF18_08385 [Anaerolineales bacterium]
MSLDLSRFGLRYFRDENHYTQADWKIWGEKFSTLGVKWLTLTASERRAIPESFLRSILDSGIRPIVHIPTKLGTLSLREIAPILKSYANWGIEHVVVYDQPNMQASWNLADWSRGELIERYVDLLLPILHIELEVGLKPMLPALEPGGDYWDTAFLEAVLDTIQRRGQSDLLTSCGVALYSWTYGRPLEWGRGGPDAWPNAKPYQTQNGVENQIGFRIYEWYQAIVQERVSSTLPFYVIAGGYRSGIQNRPENSIAIQIEMLDLLQNGQTPEYLQCFNFEAFEPQTSMGEPWFNEDRSLGPMSQAVIENQRKRNKASVAKSPKIIDHYALLATSGTQNAIKTWKKVADFAMALQPTFGFSVEEARHARRVTILANMQDISSEIQQLLEDSGCDVNRINLDSEIKLLHAITAYMTENNQAGGSND